MTVREVIEKTDTDTDCLQLIENRQAGKTCETLLVSQPARSSREREHRPVRQINNQASIDLGMLQQVRQGKGLMRPGEDDDDCQARSELQCVGETDRPGDFPDCQSAVVESSSVDNSVERFIAVPISATEQYLISSTGQTYITEKLSSPIINMKKELVESSEPGERLPPIGANSRATSKISLQLLDEETQC